MTRLSVVMLSNVISAYYKAFGQTFIKDDRFLSIVGAITSVFNCSGRLVYGMIMDKFAYKVSMTIEACLLIILMSTFYLTSLIGVSEDVPSSCLQNITENVTAIITDCVEQPATTSLTTKVGKDKVHSHWSRSVEILCSDWWNFNILAHAMKTQ